MKRVGDGMRQIRLLDHLREKIAVLLAPWVIYPDVREYHRGEQNQDSAPASEPREGA